MADSAGYGANAFINGFMQAWDHIDKIKQQDTQQARQDRLDADDRQYRDSTLALQKEGAWSAPLEAMNTATGQPEYVSINNRSGETRAAMPGYAPVPPSPKCGITTYKDGGSEITRAPLNGVPVGEPLGKSAIRQEAAETLGNPVDELDASGTPIRAQYGNRGTRRVVPGARPAPTSASGRQMSSAAMKAEDSDLESLNLASNMQADLDGFMSQISNGDLQLSPVRNVANSALNAVGASTPDSVNYASFRAALEKLRNDSLRLNKGVQTEGDAKRAWNELIANINDPAVVQQRLQEIANFNARAAQFYDKRIQSRRRTWGREQLDTSEFRAGGSAYVGGQQAPNIKAPSAAPQGNGSKDYSHLWGN